MNHRFPARLFRLAGLAALVAGLLRIASAAPLPLSPPALEALWDLIDALLSLGLVGVYLARASALGVTGVVAFSSTMAALSFIGGPDADPFGFSTYRVGAAAVAVSLGVLSVAWLHAGVRPRTPPVLWLTSLAAGGVFGAFPPPWPTWGFALAGVTFGAGFVAAGGDLWRRPVTPPAETR